ncbi:MAG TPA: GNAT family N-acetyltransferase [Candidatus Blautia merdigallinarum]|uniref:GNAT family N-acetyltransferase n=1 Tax=Candidatus Blautia merdigallinarum TaxID=2838495 RepID=A0A9D2N5W5_9FIRM|nr:GNAT family N-acetyltransferase [Candidatus Blautia merdigallinarum]
MSNKKECGQAIENLYERFEFRYIRPEEADQAARIEQVCFPPNEACTEKMMKDRAAAVPELFLVAVDRQNGQLGGFLCGLATDESRFRDEFFYDNTLYRPQGKNVILLGLDVLPEYRGQGLARELMHVYLQREKERGRKMAVLTCLEDKIPMYEKMGFTNHGLSQSAWGGVPWYEMSCALDI